MRIWLPVLAATLAACGGDGSSSPPAQSLEDTTPPVIILSGANPQIIEAGEAYVELGATASDNRDGDVSGSIVIDASAVDTAVPGEYPVTYDVSDTAGNAATTLTRTVICQDTTAPVITLTGANPQSLSQGDAYAELGATAMDTVDGDLTAMLVIDASAVDTATVGDYTVTYDVSDAAGNAAVTVMRTVSVVLTVPAVPKVSVAADIKRLIFSWEAIPYADYYQLLENPDGGSGFTQLGEDIPSGTTSVTIPVAVHLMDWLNAEYVVEACNRKGCNSSDWINVNHLMLDTIGYLGSLNANDGDTFGNSLGLSADGMTFAIGAPTEDSNARGIDGDQNDDSAEDSGAVYVYRFESGSWTMQAYVKASNSDPGDSFGASIAISGDGNTLAIGAWGEDSKATGINGDQSDNSAENSGAAYIFRFRENEWHQDAYFKGSNTDAGDAFSGFGFGHGEGVALSADGLTLAVSAPGQGGVYVFRYAGTGWKQDEFIDIASIRRVALDADGDTLAVTGGGELHILRFDGERWGQESAFAPDEPMAVGFGSVAVSANGDAVAVGDAGEALEVGAVYVYQFDGIAWHKQKVVRAPFADGCRYHDNYCGTNELPDIFGLSVQLSGDGKMLVAGALGEDGGSAGVNGDMTDNSVPESGAAYVFRFDGANWYHESYVKAAEPEPWMICGGRVSLSADKNTLAMTCLPGGPKSIYIF